MLKKSLFSSLIRQCHEHGVEYRKFMKGDVVIDEISDHNLYIFEHGFYRVFSKSWLWWVHEVGEIDSPSIIGEGVFFGSFRKPVRIVLDSWEGSVFILKEWDISDIHEKNPGFRETLMRACLSVTNERINEANTERTLGYTLVDALENQSFGTISSLLSTLKNTFTLTDVLWIERHELLHEIFAMKYRDSQGTTPVNTRVIFQKHSKEPYVEEWLFGPGFTHVYPLVSRWECYGYLVYISEKSRLPGYINRITLDMVPNCIRIIEAGWKKSA